MSTSTAAVSRPPARTGTWALLAALGVVGVALDLARATGWLQAPVPVTPFAIAGFWAWTRTRAAHTRHAGDGASPLGDAAYARTQWMPDPPEPQAAGAEAILPGLMARTDGEGRCTAVSRALAHGLGQSPAALIGTDLAQAFGPEAEAMLRPRLKAALKGRDRRLQCPLVDAQGQRRWLQVELARRLDAQGRPEGVDLLAMDVTPEQQRLEQLIRHDQRTRHLLTAMPAPLLYLSRTLTVRFANPAECRWQERSEDEVLGQQMPALYGPAWTALAPQIEAAMAGSPQPVHRSRTTAEGRVEHQLGRPMVDRDAQGQALGVFLVFSDDTERRALAEALAALKPAAAGVPTRTADAASQPASGSAYTAPLDADVTAAMHPAGRPSTALVAQPAPTLPTSAAPEGASVDAALDGADGRDDEAIRMAIAQALAAVDGGGPRPPTLARFKGLALHVPTGPGAAGERSVAAVAPQATQAPDGVQSPQTPGGSPATSTIAATAWPTLGAPPPRPQAQPALSEAHPQPQTDLRPTHRLAPPPALTAAVFANVTSPALPAPDDLVDQIEQAVHHSAPKANVLGVTLSCRFGPRLPRTLAAGQPSPLALLVQLLDHALAEEGTQALHLDISRLDAQRLNLSLQVLWRDSGKGRRDASPPADWCEGVAAAGGQWGVDANPSGARRLWFTWPLIAAIAGGAEGPCGPMLSGHVLVADASAREREIQTQRLVEMGLSGSGAPDAGRLLQRLREARQSGQPIDLVLLDGRLPGGSPAEVAARIREQEGEQAPALVLLDTSVGPEAWADAAEAGVTARLDKPLRRRDLWRTLRGLLGRERPVLAALTPLTSLAQPPDGPRAVESASALDQAVHRAARSDVALADAVPAPDGGAPATSVTPRFRTAPRVLLALEAGASTPEDGALEPNRLRQLLHDWGCDLSQVDTGVQALQALERERHDLLLLGCGLPELDAPEVLRALREREGRRAHGAPALPVLVLLDAPSGVQQRACAAAGMNEALVRPMDDARLWRTLRRWLPAERFGDAPLAGRSDTPGAVAAQPGQAVAERPGSLDPRLVA